LLQTTRFNLPETINSRDLAQELLGYEIWVSEDAKDRSGGLTVGTRDDLETALGLAVQTPQPPFCSTYVGIVKDGRLRRLGP
jgi:hypothetical protein